MLHIAAAQNDYEIISLLCIYDLELANIDDNEGTNPIDYASNSWKYNFVANKETGFLHLHQDFEYMKEKF